MPGENDEFDIASAVADIGNDLFQKDDGATRGTEEESAGGDLQSPAAQQAAQQVADEYAALPKAWKADMETHWKSLTPDVRKYVYSREADVSRGIQQYHQNHQRWDAVTKPFQPIFAQDPNFDPVPVLRNLMQTHVILANPNIPVEQKRQLLERASQEYGITPAQAAAAASQAAGELPDISQHPAFKALQQKLDGVTNTVQSSQQQQYNELLKQNTKAVEDFSKANKYFEEVAGDVHRLIRTGAATDLAGAYQMAVWANPGTREKLLADQQTEQQNLTANKRKTPLNIEGSGSARVNGGKKSTSIDDTVDAIAAKYINAH